MWKFLKKFLGLEQKLGLWKTITLGLYTTPEEYEVAFARSGVWMSGYSLLTLDRITLSNEVVDVDLGIATFEELGLKPFARYSEICQRIVELGGAMCPPEVAYALRLQYDNQPARGWLVIAVSGDLDLALHVANMGGIMRVNAHRDPDGFGYVPNARFVFVVPRK